MYMHVVLASGFILAILSPITVTANILLITAIFKDPLKYFKPKPTSLFVLGLSIADLLCGLLVEPFFAAFFFSRYFRTCARFEAISQTLFTIGSFVSTASLNSSFVMVLMLSMVQLIAIEWPYRYKAWVKKQTVIPCVLVTWAYFTIFSLFPLLGVDRFLFYKINLVLHSTLISVVLAFVQIFMYKAFTRRLLHQNLSNRYSFSRNSFRSSQQPERLPRRQTRGKLFDRNFIIMTFYLAAILLFAAFPHIGVFYVFVFKTSGSEEEEKRLNISLRITDLLLFTKVAIDAFIFAWRLPTFRKSLQCILTGKSPELMESVV